MNVNHVYQNVKLAKMLKVVMTVKNQESKLLNVDVHQVLGKMIKETVINVLLNVKNVEKEDMTVSIVMKK